MAVVETTYGKVQGSVHADGVLGFKGIPFAEPPVGGLRWKAPQAPEPWEGIRDATRYGDACAQPAAGEGGFRTVIMKAFGIAEAPPDPLTYSEDCLYLNVYTDENHEGGSRPVMVWIHGGAFRFGSGITYDAQHLVRKGVVVVTINYRLGSLGFLAHPDLTAESEHGTSGNYGLLDQLAALEWVRDNIAGFGGDPGCVTIFGESAGGSAVTKLVASPLSRGLIHRAIAQSGVGVNTKQLLDRKAAFPFSGHDSGLRFERIFGVKGISALRNISVEEVVKKSALFPGAAGPIIDGHVLTKYLGDTFGEGDSQDIPFMLGSNSDEGTALYWGTPLTEVPPPVNTVEKYLAAIERVFGDRASEVLALYPATDREEMLKSSKEIFGDSLFGAQTTYISEKLAAIGRAPYLYYFTQTPAGRAGEILGAFHASEIAYVFGAATLNPVDNPALSEQMMSTWVQFAGTGNPNHDGLPDWQPYDPTKDEYLEFGAETKVAKVHKRVKYNLLEDHYRKQDAIK
ncbi:MAG: carboxylesterase family protein [Proteobacteria bacterium]|nr:carboxylesterase family protein [Pseudomonadota bacterium]